MATRASVRFIGPLITILYALAEKLDVALKIVDKTAEPGTLSRALTIHARTLELYRQLSLVEAVIDGGRRVPAINLWALGERAARIPFETVGQDL